MIPLYWYGHKMNGMQNMTNDVIKTYEAIITNMAKLLEVQQSRESVVIDMVAAGIAAEREAIAKMVEPWLLPEYVEKIRARGNTQ